MQEAFVVQNLKSLDHLNPELRHRLQAKFLLAVVEKFSQVWAKHAHHNTVIVSRNSLPDDLGEPS
jgi:hypothetical protein